LHKNKLKKHDKDNHLQGDQFIEGKIGSGCMSTVEGQPHLREFLEGREERNPRHDVIVARINNEDRAINAKPTQKNCLKANSK